MRIAAVVQVILELPDAPSATSAAKERLAELGLPCRIVNAWRIDVRFVRLRGMKRGCTATIVEVCADDDTVQYRYDDNGSIYRVPLRWFAQAFACEPRRSSE